MAIIHIKALYCILQYKARGHATFMFTRRSHGKLRIGEVDHAVANWLIAGR